MVPTGQEVAEEDVAEDRKRRKTLRVDKLIVGREAMAQALWDVGAGRVSRTKAPLDVWYKPDCAGQPVDGYLLTDGHHRLVELLMRGPAESFTWSEVDVRQVGSGYNDYWRTPAPEERFVFTKTRYGGLEALADEDILATDTAKLVGGAAEDALGPREVPVNRLYSPRWKLEETLTEVRDGKLSRSNEQPLRLTRLDSPRGSFFILDGNHRAVEAVLAGKRTVTGIIDPEMPRIERTGGAHRDAVASKVNVVEFVRESERGGAAEDVIKLDRDAVYNGAERVVQAYARALKRVPFDKGAEAVRTWFQIEASMVEGEPTVEGASMTPFYDYPGDLKDVRGNEIEVRVMRLLVLREHNYGLIVDAFTQAVKRGRAANIWIRINLGSPEIEKLRDQPELFVPRFASIFLHELTHVRDVIKMRHVVAPEDNRLAYYNSPHEIRAYGRQIVEDVIIQARFNRDVRLAPTNEQLVERALANSQHWLQVEPWLTDENKEKIYRFVYRGLEREGLFKRSGSMRLPRTQRSRAAEDFESRADVCDDARVWYHGSPNRFDAFQARVGAPFGGDPMAVPIFLTCELATARAHAGPNGFVYTVKPTPKQIFRGQDLFLAEWPKWWPPQPDEMSSIGARLYEDLEAGRVFDDVHGEEADDALRAIARGHYDIMETGQMKQWLLDHGYDAFVVREAPRAPVSLAVMDPIRIKIVSVETYDEAWARRREVAEAPAASDAAPLPFVLVRHGHDVVPALIVDNEGDELVGVDARGRSLSFGAEDIVGLVNAEPAAVYYGVRVEAHEESMRMAAEAGQPGAKKGDVLHTYPGLKVIKGGAFKVRPRGERFQWTPEKPKGLTAFPEVKKVLMKQREGVPSLESIRMAAIFAGLTVHAGTSEAEDTFGRVVAKYKAMHGAMPPVEEIQQIIGTHLPAARLRMYETVLPWAVIVQDAMKRGLRDRELRRHIWVDIADEDQVENIGLAKMSFAFMLMGQNMCCLDSHILGGMAATKPWDPNDPQGAAIRRRDAGDRISGLWKWSPAKKGRELGLRRYEQLEDALIKGNPWHESGPLDRAQTQWQSWEFAIGIPAAHRVWLEITKELQTRQSDWDLQQVSVPF